jgi:hypothetical protein
MNIDKKELFEYLDNYIFETQTELKWEINQRICMKHNTKYYNEWTITDRLYEEYLDYKTK